MQHMLSTHFFFYKNIVYKNIEPQVLGYFKNIFIAEIVEKRPMFLSNISEAQFFTDVLKYRRVE